MSGHSKWANIKHKKGKADAERGKIFTKIGREIAIAVRDGGSDPAINGKLRDVIAKAKASNMPNENIKRSIAKAAGALACKPLFESYPGHEGDERRFGLDRWYKLDLKKGTSLETVATALSSQKKIERVQYNTRMRNVVTRRPHPYVSNIQTKAVQSSNAAFNDPMLSKQWSYHNAGNGNPVWNSVAGADVNVVDAWKLTAGDPSVIVAVVDEGVAYSHPVD